MEKITPAILRLIRADIDKALEAVGNKYGLGSIKAGHGSYASNTFTIKIEGVLNATAEKEKTDAESNSYATMLGLPENIVGRKIRYNNKVMEVTKIDIGKPKYPVIAEDVISKTRYKLPVDMVLRNLMQP